MYVHACLCLCLCLGLGALQSRAEEGKQPHVAEHVLDYSLELRIIILNQRILSMEHFSFLPEGGTVGLSSA